MRVLTENILIKASLITASMFAALFIGEGMLRVMFSPVDYLKPKVIQDPVYGVRIKPYSGGHDSWGYRNKMRPKTADIVAIGDSQTYGISATAQNSWPKVLGSLLDKDVYNLSLGGYNPVCYYQALKDEAHKLNPTLVIVGFYLGNDFLEASQLVYNRPNLVHLRNSKLQFSEANSLAVIPESERIDKTMVGFRDWLSQNSVLYRFLTHSAIGDLARLFESKVNRKTDGQHYINFEDRGKNITTVFTPSIRLKAMDLSNAWVKEGLRIALNRFDAMSEFCREKNIKLLVVMIPTKENVFFQYFQENQTISGSKSINELVKNETKANELVKKHFQENNIAYLDLLGPLSREVAKTKTYPRNEDGHPNKNGYLVIARAIAGALKNF